MTADEMAALHRAAFTLPRPWDAAEIADLLAQPSCFALTRSGGFLIGRVVADEGELLTVAVDPATRRQGTGQALVSAFLERAANLGAANAFLEVAADNGAAIALYSGLGFAPAGRRKGYYQGPAGPVDALIFSRTVDRPPSRPAAPGIF